MDFGLQPMPAPRKRRGGAPDYGFGYRADGSPKGLGFFGVLKRPDGKISSELSIGVDFGGKETEIPTLVPSLTRSEVEQLLALDPEKDKIPAAIVDKAVAHARARLRDGMSPFAAPGEQIDLPKR